MRKVGWGGECPSPGALRGCICSSKQQWASAMRSQSARPCCHAWGRCPSLPGTTQPRTALHRAGDKSLEMLCISWWDRVPVTLLSSPACSMLRSISLFEVRPGAAPPWRVL